MFIKVPYLQIIRDLVKRRFIDFARRSDRLNTPMDTLIASLRVQHLLPKPFVALELFGMHGLWHTTDYASLCDYLEIYELNETYARFASARFKQATVVTADSVLAVKSATLRMPKYTFIVVDNPLFGIFGRGYAEHFDFFPEIGNFIEEGVVVMNFIHRPMTRCSEGLLLRRTAFYGKPDPTWREAARVYERHFKSRGLAVVEEFLIPRTSETAYLAFALAKAPAALQEPVRHGGRPERGGTLSRWAWAAVHDDWLGRLLVCAA